MSGIIRGTAKHFFRAPADNQASPVMALPDGAAPEPNSRKQSSQGKFGAGIAHNEGAQPAGRRKRGEGTMLEYIKHFFQGVVIGVANIIPGVSGGTMALVLGIYERLIGALHAISARTAVAALGLLRFKPGCWREFASELRRIDAVFLVLLGTGAVTAIVALANLMTYLLSVHHDPTYGFFLGLVAVSAWVPYKLIRKKNLACFMIGLVAVIGVAVLSQSMGSEALVEKEQAKQTIKLDKDQRGQAAPARAASGQHRPGHLLYLFAAGAVAISAMILPGISGSFLLLLMGTYFEILKAIVHRDLIVLAVFALGCVAGLLAFTRLLDLLLKKWHDLTMAFLLGLVLGSLWAIWPFRESVQVGEKTVYLGNQWPAAFGANEALTLLAALLGGALVAIFIWYEARQPAAGR